MSKQELQAILAAVERFAIEHASTPEMARKVLRDEGVLTETNQIAAPYAQEPPSAVA